MSDTFETIEMNIRGVDTVIKATGAGKPVIYLHGAATLEGFDFAHGLSDRFRMLLPSHPGMGFSGPAPHITGMQDLLIHYLDMMDMMGLEKPHLVGISMGGWMAAELAAVAGERFDKLVLLCPAGLNDPDFPPKPLPEITPEELPGYLMHDVSVALRYFPGGDLCPPVDQFVADRTREMETVGRIVAPFGMGHPNLARFLGRIPNETLIVWGEQDRMLPPGQAHRWASHMKNAKVHMVADAGHLVLQEKPETLQSIGDFLAG